MFISSENIRKTLEFVKKEFTDSVYFKDHPEEKEYRYNHTIRVASIGQMVARKEALDEEALVIGCLLHDISYTRVFEGEKGWLDHGRDSAKIARPFLKSLGLNDEIIAEICFGIAIHVDDVSDFDGERTPLAVSIGDCDNIDRFDAYRLYENLRNSQMDQMTLTLQIEYVNKVITKLNQLKSLPLGTVAGKELWNQKLDFQIHFYETLLNQLNLSIIN